MKKKKTLDTASSNSKPPKLQIPKVYYVDFNLINPIQDEINGGIDAYRWGRKNQKEKDAIQLHIDSFKLFGLLTPFVVVKVPEAFTAMLDGKPFRYQKDSYITVDLNGRLRTLKQQQMLGKLYIDEVPISDVSETLLKGETKITAEVKERISDAVIALSTGNLDWKIYNFVSQGADVIEDPKVKAVHTYFRDSMRKYGGSGLTLTNNNVVNVLMGRLPNEKELRTRVLDYDMRYKRYSNFTLEKLLELRQQYSKAVIPATFLDKLGRLILQAAYQTHFIGCDWNYDSTIREYVRDTNTEKHIFHMGNGIPYDIYSDNHYFAFVDSVEKVLNSIGYNIPRDGYQPPAAAKRHMETVIQKAPGLYAFNK